MLVIQTREGVSRDISFMLKVSSYAGGQKLKGAVKLSGLLCQKQQGILCFVLQLLKSMHIKVELPITVRVDNIVAIWMSQNVNTSSRTKHVHIHT
jgi:hypothetical protein